jgi:hypothetical protein
LAHSFRQLSESPDSIGSLCSWHLPAFARDFFIFFPHKLVEQVFNRRQIPMKRILHSNPIGVGAIVVSLLAPEAFSQTSVDASAQEDSAAWAVSSRTAHSKTWERVEIEKTPGGRQIPRVHRIGTTYIDGSPPGVPFNRIANSSYFGAQKAIQAGAHHIVTSSKPLGVQVYGFQEDDGYGYTAGFAVSDANTAPSADPQSVLAIKDTARSVTLTGSDADEDDPLYFIKLTDPSHGSLTGTIPNYTYTPSPGYVGSDSFTFKVNDGKADSAVATINITVSPNDPYDYPLKPGTPEWVAATPEARVDSLDIPQAWRDTATSWQLFRSAVTRPYFRSCWHYGNSISASYGASKQDETLSILSEIEAASDFGFNCFYYLNDVDIATILLGSCQGQGACPFDYVIVCHMASLDSALNSMDQATCQKLFRIATWDACYFNSQADHILATAPIRLMYAIYNKPESLRGRFPAGVVLPPLTPEQTTYLDYAELPAELVSAVSSVKTALGLVSRP